MRFGKKIKLTEKYFVSTKSAMQCFSTPDSTALASAPSLLDLPDEILLKILAHVATDNAVSLVGGVALSCSRLRRLCWDPSFWTDVVARFSYSGGVGGMDGLKADFARLVPFLNKGHTRALSLELLGMDRGDAMQRKFQSLFNGLMRRCRKVRSLHVTGLAPWHDWVRPPRMPRGLRRLSFDWPGLESMQFVHGITGAKCWLTGVREVEVRNNAAGHDQEQDLSWDSFLWIFANLTAFKLTSYYNWDSIRDFQTLVLTGYGLEGHPQPHSETKWVQVGEEQDEEAEKNGGLFCTLVTESGKRWIFSSSS